MAITLYDKPRCSLSRATPAIPRGRRAAPRVIDRREVPTRSGEPEYPTLRLEPVSHFPRTVPAAPGPVGGIARGDMDDPQSGEDEFVAAMAVCPRLILRPAVVDDPVAIGWPPETLQVLF